MNRRRVLAFLGGAATLGGCSSRDQVPDPATDAQTPPPDGTALVSGLEFGHRIVGAFAADTPATLELHCTNRLDTEIIATTPRGPSLPFPGRFGWDVSGDTQLLLYPNGEPDLWFQIDENELVPVSEVLPEASEDGCWRVPSTYDGIADPSGQISRGIAAESTLTHQYTLYHMYECTPGTYSFSAAVTLTADGFDTEGSVPLRLRVVSRDDGEVTIDLFGTPDDDGS